MAVKCSMPQFVARCLEEIGLEGRCGMPLRELFDAMNPENDVAYRSYTWYVLRGMEDQLTFHVMRPLGTNLTSKKPIPSSTETDLTLRRKKRKWKTTLLENPNAEVIRSPKQHKSKSHPLQPVIPSVRRIAAQKHRQRLHNTECDGRDQLNSVNRPRRRRQRSGDSNAIGKIILSKDGKSDMKSNDEVSKNGLQFKSTDQVPTLPLQKEAVDSIKEGIKDAEDEVEWVLRSPRGFRLGEKVDVRDLSYEEAVTSNQDGVLGVVACEQWRLRYLGVADATLIDTVSPQFDLLEIIGRSKVRGENAITLTNSRLFGDSRKLHYLLDVLIAINCVVKNIVTADQRRFNIVHLRRFANRWHPSMISPSASIAWEKYPKDAIAQIIVSMMEARGENTCVFADIGRELGYSKRHQEQLRSYFIQQMKVKPSFPLHFFLARCKTAGEMIGRKLWCIRLRASSPGGFHLPKRRRLLASSFDKIGFGSVGRPIVERGIMEQMYVTIQNRAEGATVPELRDVLGVPTFKLPYKLAQGLIANYNISVEQVILGKNTMYRMFVSGTENKKHCRSQHATISASDSSADSIAGMLVTRASDKYSSHKGINENHACGQYQAGTMMQAARGIVRASTTERRKCYILDQVQMKKIVSLHQLRTGLIKIERMTDATTMDIRSVRRIVDGLVEEKKIAILDITLPPKQIFQKVRRTVKCAVLLGYQRDRESIQEFIKSYEEKQYRNYQRSLLNHDNDDYVVVTNRQKQRHNMREACLVGPYEQEVVKYSAVSYKVARHGLVKQQKQSRRLGMFFGMMFKCRAFHFMIWNSLKLLSAQCTNDASLSAIKSGASSGSFEDITFALKDVLDLLTVKEYVQLVGVPELLTDQEEAAVRSAASKGVSWNALPGNFVDKLRSCEADRFSKIVRVLLDLGLLCVVQDTSSMALFNVFQTCGDFDSIVSRVAFAALSGGLFTITRHVRISIKQGARVLHRLPSKFTYAYAPGFSCKSKSDHFTGRVPLEFYLNDLNDVKAYWKSLRFLSVEGARLGTTSDDPNCVSVKLDGALIQSAPLTDHNIYVLKAWVPHSTTTTRSSTARAKAAAGPIQVLKRKLFQADVPAVAAPSHKRCKSAKSCCGSISALMTPIDTSEAGVSRFRKQVSAKKTSRTMTWTLKDDLRLIDCYLEQMSCRWFVEVPLALQIKEEHVAFRTTNISRTLISWKELGKVFKKNPSECMFRVKDLLEAPAVRARLEKTKATATQMKNPGGIFHEKAAIMSQPRLTSLLCRALQVIFHQRSSYYSVLADALMSNWSESEVKLVWRYLWLAGLITRTPQVVEGSDQKQRGFQVHSKVFEMKSLKISHYLMETFCQAAKYVTFVDENIDEATMMAEEYDNVFEHDIQANMPTGQAAVVLSSLVSGFSRLVPSFIKPRTQAAVIRDVQRVITVKGLAGHLSQQWNGVLPEDFLKDFWTVKSVFRGADVTTQARKIKMMEAFSFSASIQHWKKHWTPAKRRKRILHQSLSYWVHTVLNEAESTGATLNELGHKYAQLKSRPKCVTAMARGEIDELIQREVDELVSKGSVFEVNGYDNCRYVLRKFSDLWALHPYRITSDSTAKKVHFLFDSTTTIVARPWLHLDGSLNTKMALKLKRKAVNIVMCCPGIQDFAIYKKMRSIVSLQDMRSLLEELIISRIVYARVVRGRRSPFASVFGLANSRRSCDQNIMAFSPGELRYVNFSRDRLHYFPSINCIELLGAEACDADLG